VWEYHEGADETDPLERRTRTVGLHFQVQNSHFASNEEGHTPRMEIRCTSTVGDETRHKAVFSTLSRAATSNKLAREGFHNSAGRTCANFHLLIQSLSY